MSYSFQTWPPSLGNEAGPPVNFVAGRDATLFAADEASLFAADEASATSERPNERCLERFRIDRIDRPAGRSIAWAFRRSVAERNSPGCRCRRPDTALGLTGNSRYEKR